MSYSRRNRVHVGTHDFSEKVGLKGHRAWTGEELVQPFTDTCIDYTEQMAKVPGLTPGEEDHAQPGRTTSRRGQDSPWKSQPEWQRTEINGESTFIGVTKPSERGRLKNRTEPGLTTPYSSEGCRRRGNWVRETCPQSLRNLSTCQVRRPIYRCATTPRNRWTATRGVLACTPGSARLAEVSTHFISPWTKPSHATPQQPDRPFVRISIIVRLLAECSGVALKWYN